MSTYNLKRSDLELKDRCLQLAEYINGNVSNDRALRIYDTIYRFARTNCVVENSLFGIERETAQEDDTTDINEITAKEMMDIHTAINAGDERDHFLNKFFDQKYLLLSGKPINRAMLLAVMDFTLHQAAKTSELERVVNILIDNLPPAITGNNNIARCLMAFKANTTT